MISKTNEASKNNPGTEKDPFTGESEIKQLLPQFYQDNKERVDNDRIKFFL